MRSTLLVTLGLCAFVSGCNTVQVQPPYVPPTVTQMQGQCFQEQETFIKQTACVKNRVFDIPGQQTVYVQEYLAYMDTLVPKVKAGKITDADARLKLVERLGQLKGRQDQELNALQAQEAQRNMQAIEMLRRANAPIQSSFPIPQMRPPVNTTCRMVAGQMNCTSY